MFDDLSQVKRRYEELAYRMPTPEAMNDPAAYAAMMREYKELTPLVEAYRSYTALQKEVDEEKALLDAPTEDAAFNDMVQQELRENWQKLEGLNKKSACCFCPKMPTMKKAASWKSVRVPAARKPPCLPTACTVCTPCTPHAKTGPAPSSA